jgi:hypothetical protein
MAEMNDDPQAALAIFAEAVRALLADKELTYANPAERAIVHRLAVLLEGKFPGWSIGVEWNRREDVVKRLAHGATEDELIREGAIVPDLIVHRVGKRENLLVIEVKKASNKDFGGDIWKLEGMTDPHGHYGYAAGLHLVVDMRAGTVRKCDVYVDARLHAELTAWMEDRLS